MTSGKIKKCQRCGEEFEQRYGRPAKYCSPRCHNEAQKDKRSDPSVKKGTRQRYGPVKKCVICGESFVAYRSTALVCSRRCSGKYRSEHKDKKALAKKVKEHWLNPANRLKRAKKLKLATLDAVAREICRFRPGCEAAGFHGLQCKGSLQWAHIVGRTYHKVRWDEDNCFLLCSGHHILYTYRHIEWEEFLDQKIGRDKYEELKRRARAEGKVSRIDVYKRLLRRLEELSNESRAEESGWLQPDDGGG